MENVNGEAGGASMAGRTVVITGATSGLGASAAEALAARGARIVLIARDRARADRSLERLGRANPAARHTVHIADLSLVGETRRVAAEVAAAEPVVDVLANNAGAMFADRRLTADGLERTFATNHVAAVVLTLGLRDALRAAANARVVTTSSAAHRGMRYDRADPQMLRRYVGWQAYGRSKLCNILFTRELARRWRPFGITANCFHPGFVATRFGDESGGWIGPLVRVMKRVAITPEKGARTLVYLASAPEVAGTSGLYFEKARPVPPQPAATDDEAAAALWNDTLRLAGLPADAGGA